MFIFILGIALMVGFLICYIVNYGFDFEALAFSFLVMTSDDANKVYIEKDKTQLIALKDNFQVEGTAFLFSSSVNDQLKYTYIYETPHGMTTKSINAGKCYIKYINKDECPYIQEWELRCKSDILYWLFVISETKYTIYLPEGSVIQNVYEVNLE